MESPAPAIQLPTLAEVLALPEVLVGDPHVCAGHQRLDRQVRWVHVSELRDIADLLQGGELVLTTGIALPREHAALTAFAGQLAAAGAVGLLVELGRRYRRALPAALVEAAEGAGLVLVELRRETRFVTITQAVSTLILDARVNELTESNRAHRAFTELSLAGGGPQEIVDLAASMSGRPVLYESPASEHLIRSSVGNPGEVASDQATDRPLRSSDGDWFAVDVGPGGELGRFVMFCDSAPTPRQRMLLERAATAMMVNRLIDRDVESLERQTHRTLLTALSTNPELPAGFADGARRLGVPVKDRRLIGVAVGMRSNRPASARDLRDVSSDATMILQALRVAALVSPVDDRHVAMLISLEPRSSDETVLTALTERLHATAERRKLSLVVGAGMTVRSVDRAAITVREAIDVASSAATMSPQRTFYRLPDLRLRRLIHVLRNEPVLTDFIEEELGPVLAHDARYSTRLYEFLVAYCRHVGNKAAVAKELYLSRAVVYDRVAKLERLLGVKLSDTDVLVGLCFAVRARESLHSPALEIVPSEGSKFPPSPRSG